MRPQVARDPHADPASSGRRDGPEPSACSAARRQAGPFEPGLHDRRVGRLAARRSIEQETAPDRLGGLGPQVQAPQGFPRDSAGVPDGPGTSHRIIASRGLSAVAARQKARSGEQRRLTLRRALGVAGCGPLRSPAASRPPWRLKRPGAASGLKRRKPAFDLLPIVSLAGSRRESAQVIRAGAAPAPPAAPACRAGPPRSPAPRACRRGAAPRRAPARRPPLPPARARSSGSCPSGSSAKRRDLPGIEVRAGPRRAPDRPPGGPALSPSKHRIGSSARRQSSASWSSVSAVPSGATAWGKPGDAQRDHVDIALDGDHRAAVMGGLAGEVVIVEEPALVEERRVGRVQVFRRRRRRSCARPPKATTRPRRSQIGNMTRSRKRS